MQQRKQQRKGCKCWLKSGQVNSRQAVAKLLGRDQATITRWLRNTKMEDVQAC